jgi:hypothetical protein
MVAGIFAEIATTAYSGALLAAGVHITIATRVKRP